MDGRNPAPLSNHETPLFVGIYRGIESFQGFLRWCRISSIHSRKPLFVGIYRGMKSFQGFLDSLVRFPDFETIHGMFGSSVRCCATGMSPSACACRRGTSPTPLALAKRPRALARRVRAGCKISGIVPCLGSLKDTF